MNLVILGNRIRQCREMRGLTQADLAHALQVSAQAVSKWERGQNAPDITLVPGLTRLLGVSADWLLGCTPIRRESTDSMAAVGVQRRRRSGVYSRIEPRTVPQDAKVAGGGGTGRNL